MLGPHVCTFTQRDLRDEQFKLSCAPDFIDFPEYIIYSWGAGAVLLTVRKREIYICIRVKLVYRTISADISELCSAIYVYRIGSFRGFPYAFCRGLQRSGVHFVSFIH